MGSTAYFLKLKPNWPLVATCIVVFGSVVLVALEEDWARRRQIAVARDAAALLARSRRLSTDSASAMLRTPGCRLIICGSESAVLRARTPFLDMNQSGSQVSSADFAAFADGARTIIVSGRKGDEETVVLVSRMASGLCRNVYYTIQE